MSHQKAARQIGLYFPGVKDKLLNTIQLQQLGKDDELVAASIRHKTAELSVVSFPAAVNIKENRRYAKYLIAPGGILLIVLIFMPQLLTESGNRLINFEREFVPLAPFDFILENKDLKAFKNENYSIGLRFEGNMIPEFAYINTLGRKVAHLVHHAVERRRQVAGVRHAQHGGGDPHHAEHAEGGGSGQSRGRGQQDLAQPHGGLVPPLTPESAGS